MEDWAILDLFFTRSEYAIVELDAKYGALFHSLALNILNSSQDAEECVNDTWLRAWNAMPPHRPSLLSAFLGKITRNLAFDRFSYLRAEKRGGGELPAVLEELGECVSNTDDLEQAVDERELARAIDDFLAALPAAKRDVFIRRYWHTESVSSIGRRYGMRDGAVSMTLSRLRQKLRVHLQERGFEP